MGSVRLAWHLGSHRYSEHCLSSTSEHCRDGDGPASGRDNRSGHSPCLAFPELGKSRSICVTYRGVVVVSQPPTPAWAGRANTRCSRQRLRRFLNRGLLDLLVYLSSEAVPPTRRCGSAFPLGGTVTESSFGLFGKPVEETTDNR
jgi:hypothetical protein